eukprot:jgi/Chrzof1/13071/Cz07g18230.t1
MASGFSKLNFNISLTDCAQDQLLDSPAGSAVVSATAESIQTSCSKSSGTSISPRDCAMSISQSCMMSGVLNNRITAGRRRLTVRPNPHIDLSSMSGPLSPGATTPTSLSGAEGLPGSPSDLATCRLNLRKTALLRSLLKHTEEHLHPVDKADGSVQPEPDRRPCPAQPASAVVNAHHTDICDGMPAESTAISCDPANMELDCSGCSRAPTSQLQSPEDPVTNHAAKANASTTAGLTKEKIESLRAKALAGTSLLADDDDEPKSDFQFTARRAASMTAAAAAKGGRGNCRRHSSHL